MSHLVKFENSENTWMNGLPLGNGVFGAMAFYEDGVLSLPMNHYEVYYNISAAVLPADKLAGCQGAITDPGALHRSYEQRAEDNIPPEGEPYCVYRQNRKNAPDYAAGSFSGAYPVTGELKFLFDDSLKNASSALSLDVEAARVDFSLTDGSRQLKLEIIVARQDCIVVKVNETEKGLLRGVQLYYPPYRDRKYPDISFSQPDSRTVSYFVEERLPDKGNTFKPFRFSGAVRLKNAACTMKNVEYGVLAEVDAASEEFEFITGIFTQWRYENLPDYGMMDRFEDTDALRAEHAAYWQDFFSRGNISLPDKFLEKLWYVNQYALDCCSGKDGIMKHHACGLNGLWAVRHPNLWGSMWYWDVNIQAAFAGVFSSNRLDLGKVFSDGLRTYTELAEWYAKKYHDLPGVSIDYPYFTYFCVWPWCAQYLWFQYEYSQDVEYLRTDAYPLFLKLCEFTLALFRWDDARQCYVVYPDISPEQGPLAHNTVITVASVKYMLQFTLKAAEILGDSAPILADVRKLLDGMPEYAMCDSDDGPRFKDSEDAPNNLWIRHPGMLMPVFPVGEIDMDSDAYLRQIAENTIDFLDRNCEIGIFQSSWLSAAASRLGKGQKALRLLYERGIDHMLRSNGLSAEGTERFLNLCLIIRQPLYYPCMMEFTGEMLAAVNEMLLQSHNNLIRIFPAIPDGKPEYDRVIREGKAIGEYNDFYVTYDAWKNIKFTKMLAKGAFEVSAEMKDGEVAWVSIHSKVGGPVRITTPAGFEGFEVYCGDALVASAYENGILTFDTTADSTYVIKADPAVSASAIEADAHDTGFMEHMTYTKRRISIGETPESTYQREFDNFTRSWYLGDSRVDNHTVYRFDITKAQDKDYGSFMPRQVFAAQPGYIEPCLPFIPLDATEFTAFKGFGFDRVDRVTVRDTGAPDMLRRDFAESTEPCNFMLELPRGHYELLLISGSSDEESVTCIQTENGYRAGGKLTPAGNFQIETVPLYIPRDGIARIQLSTTPGHKWKLNAVFLNILKGYGC